MIRAALLALAIILGGGAPQVGVLLDAVSAGWASVALDAGNMADPDGLAAPTDVGTNLDPDGAVESDAFGHLNPNG